MATAYEGDLKWIGAEFDVIHIITEFIPISSMGRASAINSISISIALLIISTIRDSGSQMTSFEYSRRYGASLGGSKTC